jgi:hypothetical protein
VPSTKEVLVETDDLGPRRDAHAPLPLELLIERAVDEAARAAIRVAHVFERAEAFARPEHLLPEALGETGALANARDGLGERLATAAAEETPLADAQDNAAAAQGRVADVDDAMVVHRRRRAGAPRAHLGAAALLHVEVRIPVRADGRMDQMQFRQE